MKRLVSLFVALVALITCLLVTASATVYTEVFDFDFTGGYRRTVSDSNGDVDMTFSLGFFSTTPCAYTGMDMPNGGMGWVFVFLACQDLEAKSANSSEVNNNYVACSIDLSTPYATKSQHVLSRSANGVTNAWDYTYVSEYHDDPTGRIIEILPPKIS